MADSPAEDMLAEYIALRAKVDAFCHVAAEASGAALRCAPGCSACCVAGLSLSPVEARVLEGALKQLGESSRAPLRARRQRAQGCVLLDEQGRSLGLRDAWFVPLDHLDGGTLTIPLLPARVDRVMFDGQRTGPRLR